MYTPGLRDVLQVEAVTLQQWVQLLMFALTLIVVDEVHKYWHLRKDNMNDKSQSGMSGNLSP